MTRLQSALRDWAASRGRLVVLAVVVVIVGSALFFAFGTEVAEGDTQKFDEWVVMSLRSVGDPGRPLGPDWLAGSIRDITALGSLAIIGLFSGIVLGFAAMRGNGRLSLLILGAALGGLLLNTVLKDLFDRPRPRLPHIMELHSRSFPSGHAMVSATVYLSLAAVLATREKRRLAKVYLLSVGLLLTGLVGLSRIYLGFHYPTDVLAGWLAGLVWAVLCALATQALLGRKKTD
jgi:undecaprenyl-diphosphatase